MTKPFDTVVVTDHGQVKELTPEEFRQMNLTARVQLLIQDRVSFRLGATVVPTREALKFLAQQSAERSER